MPEVLAMALLGRLESLKQGAGTVSEQAVMLIPGRWVQLGHRNIGDAAPNLRCALLLNDQNQVTREQGVPEIDSATLTPTNGVDLMSGEFVITELKGSMSIVSGDAPYRFDLYTTA